MHTVLWALSALNVLLGSLLYLFVKAVERHYAYVDGLAPEPDVFSRFLIALFFAAALALMVASLAAP